ncbi:hypothetical protein AOQ84DRAFT_364848 [Glonium stellatum]|uniref:Uncharacterized protein n=1 Tax=Glonium stellatum TaxID=574774 RepID=A0A8E2EZ62_9PEZI|nr:hypothetical protein AOQ84DRAFT_364848 [Glonium stellatum]
MSIFSKVKNAKKAAEQHKRASSQAQAEVKPPTPYKHVPTHAAQDALSCAPTSWSAEESRAKISAANRRKSDMSRRSSFVRANSEPAMASRGHIQRTESDLSIDSVITKQRHSSHPSPSQYSYSGYVPPPRSRSYLTNASSSSSMVMKRSPLSNTSTEEEEDAELAESSKNSTHSSTSSQAIEMKLTTSRETKTKSSESKSKTPTVEITSPNGEEEPARAAEKTKGRYFSHRSSSLPNQTPTLIPQPTVTRKTSRKSWFGRRNTVSVH